MADSNLRPKGKEPSGGRLAERLEDASFAVDGGDTEDIEDIGVPERFGSYLLLDRLDGDERSEVFRACAKGGELLVIKRIDPSRAASRNAVEQFAHVVEVAAQFAHPSLARILDRGWEGDTYYLAREHVFGRDLRRLLEELGRRGEQVSPTQAAYLVFKICEGLAHIHSHPDPSGRVPTLVHRNVSPKSTLISVNGDIKLINFGMAKTTGRSKTVSGIVRGTYGYMSPEQVRGLPVDARSDVFSCGIVLYELLTGVHPFLANDEFQMLEKVRKGEFRPPRDHLPEMPMSLDHIVQKALAKHVDDRYQQASELQDELQSFLFSAGMPYGPRDLGAQLSELFGGELDIDSARLAARTKLARRVLGVPSAVTDLPKGAPTQLMSAESSLLDDGMPDTVEARPVIVETLAPPARKRGGGDDGRTKLYEESDVDVELLARAAARGRELASKRRQDTDITPGPGEKSRAPSIPPLGPPPGGAFEPSPETVPPAPLMSRETAEDLMPAAHQANSAELRDGREPWSADSKAKHQGRGGVSQTAPTRDYGEVLAERALMLEQKRERESSAEPPPSARPTALASSAEPATDMRPPPAVPPPVPASASSRTRAPGQGPQQGQEGKAAPAPAQSRSPSPSPQGAPVPTPPGASPSLPPPSAGAARRPVAMPAVQPEQGAAASARGRRNRIIYIVGSALVALSLVLGGALAARHLAGDDGAEGDIVDLSEDPAAAEPPAGDEAEPAAAAALPAEVSAQTGIDLFVEPAEAVVRIDGKVIDLPAPMRIRDLAPGAHELMISAPQGYFSKSQSLVVEAGKAELVHIALEPIEVSGRFTSEPAGARVELVPRGDGAQASVDLGVTPAEAPLAAGQRYDAVFSLAGYVDARIPVEPGSRPELTVHAQLSAEPSAAAPAPTKPSPAPTRRAATRPRANNPAAARTQPARRAEASAPASDQTGVLMLGSKPPCRIYIDGKDTGKLTPQRALELPVGRHRIRLVNSDYGIEESFSVTIRSGETARVIKDMSERIP
ncbi:protein kinase domain-containing protein [Haliangium ochraceum]|uniref:Serine/threonine protein kinase n=1 Tax=Haliangium ochraceum (strain DSM 14365 / JCM 11303 / SMP-2) TaxID=502025 RepID=D0LW31_HALO1|nr:protein kinase [Haliangium ochraceum]ACY15963.1 serine/threonine protein kinase [Haliangium ochraceum DSM 14365]